MLGPARKSRRCRRALQQNAHDDEPNRLPEDDKSEAMDIEMEATCKQGDDNRGSKHQPVDPNSN